MRVKRLSIIFHPGVLIFRLINIWKNISIEAKEFGEVDCHSVPTAVREESKSFSQEECSRLNQ
jgi:hypothetical protein